jgi:SHS family lactate transporter-like MFS transporter
MLNTQQWLFFLVAFFAWTWDAFDFFTVSLTVTDIAATFGKENSQITWGITLVLMLRSVGAIIFGIAADRYGRKWPFIINNVLFIVLELATGFCTDYKSFLAVRALFGIAMGGLYGNAASTALEDCPPEARGLCSGILQQGYSLGYLLATVFTRALVNTTSHGWRPLFWFGAGPPVLIIIFRLFLPETNAFQERQKVRKAGQNVTSTFLAEGKVALRKYWLLLIYMVLLMAGFNFMSHGSQDLYPTMLEAQYGFSADAVTVTQVVANLGCLCGGTIVGYCSQIFGRRLSIIVTCIVGGALLYPYTYTSSTKVIAPAFFEQFCVQGAWGVIPIHLMEMSPDSFRTFVVGTSYQLGNLISSASSTIEATIGERFPLPPQDGEKRYEYGKVICIFMACVFVYVILLTFIGPEFRGRDLDVAHDGDLAEVAGQGAVARAVGHHDRDMDEEKGDGTKEPL